MKTQLNLALLLSVNAALLPAADNRFVTDHSSPPGGMVDVMVPFRAPPANHPQELSNTGGRAAVNPAGPTQSYEAMGTEFNLTPVHLPVKAILVNSAYDFGSTLANTEVPSAKVGRARSPIAVLLAVHNVLTVCAMNSGSCAVGGSSAGWRSLVVVNSASAVWGSFTGRVASVVQGSQATTEASAALRFSAGWHLTANDTDETRAIAIYGEN